MVSGKDILSKFFIALKEIFQDITKHVKAYETESKDVISGKGMSKPSTYFVTNLRSPWKLLHSFSTPFSMVIVGDVKSTFNFSETTIMDMNLFTNV